MPQVENDRASIKRSVGFWMAVAIGGFQTLNAIRAALDPMAFADYMGLPVIDPDATGFVFVYALRTAFIGALVLTFCIRQQIVPLIWMALLAVPLPVGDALLAAAADAPSTTVIRHAAIALFLFVTFLLLWRSESGAGSSPR